MRKDTEVKISWTELNLAMTAYLTPLLARREQELFSMRHLLIVHGTRQDHNDISDSFDYVYGFSDRSARTPIIPFIETREGSKILRQLKLGYLNIAETSTINKTPGKHPGFIFSAHRAAEPEYEELMDVLLEETNTWLREEGCKFQIPALPKPKLPLPEAFRNFDVPDLGTQPD